MRDFDARSAGQFYVEVEVVTMRRYLDQTLVVVLLVLGLTLPMGCGGPASSPQSTESANKSPNEEVRLTGPAATVHAFLEGARRGDNEVCASMLTNLARTKMAEAQLPFAPPASDTARFELGEVQIPNDQLARVACRWIETDPTTKQTQAQDATYLLRNDSEGWRIAGVARIVLENEPPLLLNYEDPEDMVRQAQLLQAEITRRAQATGSPATAQSPEAPSQR